MSLHGNRKLNKPFRTPSASKKFGVYVRNKRSGKQLNTTPVFWAMKTWQKGFKL